MMATLHQLWKYSHWANNLLFTSFEQYGEAIPASCIRLLSHIADTESAWLNRITGEKQVLGVWEILPFEDCKKWLEQTSQGFKEVMEKHAEDPFKKVNYVNTQGLAYTNTVYDILLHVFNHGTYHRAQIAQEMRRNGLEPVYTDYILFVR